MKRSLFARYFAITFSIIIISITFLGAVLLVCASQYFQTQKYEQMENNLDRAVSMLRTSSSIVIAYDESGKIYYEISSQNTSTVFSLMSTFMDSTYFLTDSAGQVKICSEQVAGEICVHNAYIVPDRVMKEINEDGAFTETGKLDGLYSENHYIVGVSIDVDGTTIGYMFEATPSDGLMTFLMEIFNMFIISSGIVIFLAFVIIFIVTSQLVRPLKEMSDAASQYGKGDFTKRLDVYRDDEIGQLAQTLNTMADDLSTLESSRRSFTANVSHELKTPMTTIGGFIDGILDGTIPESEHKKYLRIVSEEVARLSRMVRSMLDLSKIEAGEMTVNSKPFNAINAIAQILFSFETAINDKNLEIRGLEVGDVWVNADEDLIYQVIYNLMDNAVKFASQNGYIEFTFSTVGSKTNIGIRNSGQGLAAAEINKVFDRFYKTDKSRGLDKNGVGLGLYIVKNIINLHDGDIRVSSLEGEYTEFSITLSTAKPPLKSRKNNEQE